MRRILLAIFTMIVLTLSGDGPLFAQDGSIAFFATQDGQCGVAAADIQTLLSNIQADLNNDNIASANSRISEALTLLENNCAALARDDQGPGRVLLLDAMTGWDGLDYIRLMEIAAQRGIELQVVEGRGTSQHTISGADFDGIIVFGGGGGSNESSYGGTSSQQLADLQLFARNGGRFVFFALPRIDNFNDSLSTLFDISAGSEAITPYRATILALSGDYFSSFWTGLEIGSTRYYEDNLRVATYFASLDPSQDWTSMHNEEGAERKTSVHGHIGAGEYLFVSNFATGGGGIAYRNEGNILHDGNIDYFDNAIAAERLLDWLVGRSGY